MLTTSPSAVKSSTVVPSPVAQNATPVWTAVRTGMDIEGVVLACAARSARSTAAATAIAGWCGPLMPPKKSPITSSPTTLSTMPS
jgi:hypothetical protein